jgi:uncharacterized membrane protein YhdT
MGIPGGRLDDHVHFTRRIAMTAPNTPAPDTRAAKGNRWHWLLVIPVVVPLLVFLYNDNSPRLFGFPRFYWLQLAFILLSVAFTILVYQLTKRRG